MQTDAFRLEEDIYVPMTDLFPIPDIQYGATTDAEAEQSASRYVFPWSSKQQLVGGWMVG